jgi:hypothetical protein
VATSRERDLDDVARAEAELRGDGGVGPERTAGAVGGEGQEEEEGDRLEAQIAAAIAQPMIDPSEVGGPRAHAGGVHGIDSRGRVAHSGGSGAKNPPLLWGGLQWNT